LGIPVNKLVRAAGAGGRAESLMSALEDALHTLGRELARRDAGSKKRLRDDASSGSDATCCLDEAAEDWSARCRVQDAAKAPVRANHVTVPRAAEAFVARVATGAWLAVQAAAPVEFGLAWAALLAVLLHATCCAFDDVEWVLREAKLKRVLESVIMELAKAGAEVSKEGERLMRAARGWSRAGDEEKLQSLLSMWDLVHDTRAARLALDGALWSCRRAHLLFK